MLAATWALYLVAVQAILWTPLLTHELNRAPDNLMVAYERAWSVWPGRVHVNGLRIRTRDYAADVLISIEHADASFDLVGLLARRMTVRDVEAAGVGVQVRLRYGPGEIGKDTLEGQPDIPGVPDPHHDPEHRRFVSDADYRYFTIDLQKVVADPVREVWIGPYRYTGDMRVEGSLFLRPARKLAIGPAHVDVRSGDLVLAKRPLGQTIRGTIDCTVPMTNTHGIDPMELARRFAVDLDLASGVEDLAFLHRYLSHTELQIDGGAGTVAARLFVRNGLALEGSALEVHTRRLAAHHPRFEITTDLSASIAIEAGSARAHATLSHGKTSLRWAESWPITFESAAFAARSKSLDLTRGPFDDLVVSADASAIRITDVRMLRLFEHDVKIGKGEASVRAHVDLDTKAGLVAAEGSLSAPRVEASYEGVAVTTGLYASAKMPKLDLVTMKGAIPTLRVDLKDVEVRADGGGDAPPQWWAWLEARDVAFDGEHVVAELAAKMHDARPIVYVLGARGEVPKWTRGLLVMDGLTARAHFETGPQRIEIDRFEAQGGAWKSSGHFKHLGTRSTGELYLGNGTLGVKIPLDSGGGGPSPAIGGGPRQSQ